MLAIASPNQKTPELFTQGFFGHKLGASMREWLLMLIPIALVLYFAVFPDQFSASFHWLGQLFFQ
jgi:hypothetical protein